MVRPEGIEPPTLWFVARYSIQLSYGRINFGGEGGIRTLDGLLTHTPLAGERLRPLGHLSIQWKRIISGNRMSSTRNGVKKIIYFQSFQIVPITAIFAFVKRTVIVSGHGNMGEK